MKEIAALNFLCAVIGMKWGLDYGVSQARQLVFGLGCLIFGPIGLLIIYISLLYKAVREGKAGSRIL